MIPSHEKMIFVSIRVHSWFKIVFRVFRVFRGSKLFFVCFVLFVVSFLPPQATRGGIAARARNGSPLQSDHALPSPPSSLLSTLEAHCKVTTHYFLLPPPYSLLNHNYRFIVGFRVDIEGCDLSVLPCCIHREASPCPEAVELSILPGLWKCRQQMYDTCV